MERFFTNRIFRVHKTIHTNKIFKRTAVDLAYKVYGPAPKETAIIILHGLLGSKRNWNSVSKSIADESKKTVVTADLRNHGDSPHLSSHTYPELASDVKQLIDKLSLKEAILIGHSMGGRTSMYLALNEPKLVSKLVVVDISPVSTAGILNDFFPRLLDVMSSVKFDGVTNIGLARTAALDKFRESKIVDDPNSLSFVLLNIGMRDNKITWNCNIDALGRHFQDIALFPPDVASKSYSGPTLFIGGSLSNYIPKEDLAGIKELFPNADLKYVPNVGHNVHAEDPNTFLSLVMPFLSK